MRRMASVLLATALPLASARAEQEPAHAQSAPAEDRTEAAPQISNPHDRDLSADQLSAGPAARQPVTQITRALPTAQAPEPLSQPSAGRTGAVERVQGNDRCDPAVPTAKRTKICNDVIEARANEFQRRKAAELSPEQRLLLTRQLQGGGDDVANATQRLGRNGETDDPLELGIAATVLNRNQPPQNEDQGSNPQIDAATQAIVNAILVNQITPH